MNYYYFLLLVIFLSACNGPELMRVPEIVDMPAAPTDGLAVPVQFGDLRLPGGDVLTPTY